MSKKAHAKKTGTKKRKPATAPKTANPHIKSSKPKSSSLTFADNLYAQTLFGSHNAHLALIEDALGVVIQARGAEVFIDGSPQNVETTERVLIGLYDRLTRAQDVGTQEVVAALRMTGNPERSGGGDIDDLNLEVRTQRRVISPRSTNQAEYLRAIDSSELVFGLGPAGTGKTYLAVAKAVERLVRGEVDRIILSRPAVEAGEQLGFLPGDMREKVDPYLRPLYDALYDMLPAEQVVRRLENGEIEVAPLAFMRGRTLANAFVILDEAQNTSAVQMKMFLTRLGENARMVITGDLSQVDLPKGQRSGLRDACETLEGVKGVSYLEFTSKDVVRHPLVTSIVEAYDRVEAKRHDAAPYEKND